MSVSISSPALAPEARPGRLAGRLGLAGGWVSIACPIHCALTPVVATSLPFLREGPLGEALEGGLIGVSVVLGVVGVWLGYRAHRSCRVPAALAAGVVLLVLGRTVEDVGSGRLGTALMVTGGIVAALSHVLNRRCCAACGSRGNAAGSSEGGLGGIAP
jgi:hypothetical protein